MVIFGITLVVISAELLHGTTAPLLGAVAFLDLIDLGPHFPSPIRLKGGIGGNKCRLLVVQGCSSKTAPGMDLRIF